MTPYVSTHWYYVDASDQMLGPFCIETLDAFFVEGIISLNTRVLRERGTDFQPYSVIFTDPDLRISGDVNPRFY
ncbi:MAG: GYF domain-containing protein [Chthoniobacteraceae bacterium]